MNYKIDNYLKDSFYKIVGKEVNENGFVSGIRLNSDHWIFSVHFPNHPITPGVCLLQIAKELIVSHYNQPLQITLVRNLKFLNVVIPDNSSTITFNCAVKKENDNSYKADVVIENADTCCAKISFILTVVE